MNRCLAFLLALMFATLTVSSACIAAMPAEWIGFTLRPESGDRIHASFRDEERDRDRSSWSTGFRPSELVGLDLAGFRGSDCSDDTAERELLGPVIHVIAVNIELDR